MKEDLQIRELSMDILLTALKGEEHSHVLIKAVLDKYDDWESGRKAFLKKLTMGVLERKVELDYVISLFSKTPVSKMKPLIRVVLEQGVYQILYMDNVYDTKACNLAVELAKKRGFKNLSGFVNGVLRSVARQKAEIVYPLVDDDPVLYLSVKYSIPSWIVEKLLAQYDFPRLEKSFSKSMEEAPIRVHVKSTLSVEEKQKLLSAWKESQIEAEACKYLPDAYTLYGIKPESAKTENNNENTGKEGGKRIGEITELAGFADGCFHVQDYSSQLVGYLTPLKAGDIVVDVCASPGGKSMYVADRLAFLDGERLLSKVYSFDVSEKKLVRMRENFSRMRLNNIECDVWDATVFNEKLHKKADVVLADVPCSGLGVIGRKPDLKYRLKEQDLADIVELQKKIVSASVQDLKPGGYFIYSTCTVNKGENEEMVRWMCENLPLEEMSISEVCEKEAMKKESPDGGAGLFPEELKENLVSKGCLQLLTGEHEADGFFIAMMVKR